MSLYAVSTEHNLENVKTEVDHERSSEFELGGAVNQFLD
jgi:hypothetical protein